MRQAVEAVAHVHAAGLIHRDVPAHSRAPPGRLTRGLLQAGSLEVTESRNTTSPPEPKFFVKFIFPPEPDGRIRRKKLHTTHRSPQNRFFENLYKSLFPS